MNQLFIPKRIRVEVDKIVHVRRQLLSGGCDINFKLGQNLSPSDVLCQGQKTSGFWMVHLASELSVRVQDAPKFLKRKIGQTIFQGEILAEKVSRFGLGKKLIFAPVDGIIESYDCSAGMLKIKMSALAQKVLPGVYGIVDAIDNSSNSVVIRTQATIIHGVLGCGKQKCGMLKVLKNESNLVGSSQITSDLRGKVVVGGAIAISEALKAAESVGVAGLIIGGIDIWDFKAVSESLGLTSLLVTEGLGSISIGRDIFAPLSEFDGKFVILGGSERTLVLPGQQPASNLPINPNGAGSMAEIKTGLKVRIIADPFYGVQGLIEAVDAVESLLPSGLRSTLVTIATERRKIRQPYQNIEAV